jgi:hypothetical protein
VTFFYKLCGYTKIRQKKIERKTLLPSKFLRMTTGRRFWNQKKKKKNCFRKILWRKNFETWRICFQKMKENIKRFCDFQGFISPFVEIFLKKI